MTDLPKDRIAVLPRHVAVPSADLIEARFTKFWQNLLTRRHGKDVARQPDFNAERRIRRRAEAVHNRLLRKAGLQSLKPIRSSAGEIARPKVVDRNVLVTEVLSLGYCLHLLIGFDVVEVTHGILIGNAPARTV